jgi:hypothetical protein
MRHLVTLLLAAPLVSGMACGTKEERLTARATPTDGPTSPGPNATASAERTFPLVVMSGREQPAARTENVGVGQPLVLRVRGLGPARAKVFAPNGSVVATADTTESGEVVQRFRPHVPGRHRVVQVDAEQTELLVLVVTGP